MIAATDVVPKGDDVADRNLFTIDPDRLDREWADMPGQTRKVGYAEADADFAASRAKSFADVTYARLELAARREPVKFGLGDAPTNPAVKAAVEMHADYQAAVEALHRAEYALKIAKAETAAMADKRRGLENMVELKRIEYYGEREPKPLSAGAAEVVSAARKRAARTGGE